MSKSTEIEHWGFKFVIPDSEQIIGRSDGDASDPWIFTIQRYGEDNLAAIFPYSCLVLKGGIKDGLVPDGIVHGPQQGGWLFSLNELRELGKNLISYADEMRESI